MIENIGGLDGPKLSLNGWNGNVCFWMELVRFTVNRYFVLIRFAPTPTHDEVFWVCFRIQIETSTVFQLKFWMKKQIQAGCTVCPTRYRYNSLISRKTKVYMIRLKIVFEQFHTFGSGFYLLMVIISTADLWINMIKNGFCSKNR